MRIRSIFSAILACVMTVSMISFTAFATETEIQQPEIVGNTISVDSVPELKWLSDYSYKTDATQKVNNVPFDFAGYTVKITGNIENVGSFTPIKEFRGNMIGEVADQEYATISGMTVNEATGKAGLCAWSGNGSFSNLIISNSSIHTDGAYAGAFAGNGFTSSFNDCKTINVHVSGMRFVGGITGSCYGNITNCEVSSDTTGSASVVANNPLASLLSLEDGDNIGGIVGLMGEGGMRVFECTVNGVTITGARQVGGIAGFENYGNTIDHCYVYNSTLSANGTGFAFSNRTPNVGGIVGQFGVGTSTQWMTVTNCIVKNVEISQALGGTSYIGWAVGDSHYKKNENYYKVSGNSQDEVTLKKAGAVVSLAEIGHVVTNLKTDN